MPIDLRPQFAELYEPFAPALYAWAVLRCRGPLGTLLEADDLVQETCVEAFRSIDGYQPERGAFRGWLFGVATRVASGALRRHARRAAVTHIDGIDLLEKEPLAQATTISRRVRRAEAVQRFAEFTTRLDEEERRLLLHRGLEALPHAEVAELLRITPEAAAKRWQRLCARLQEQPEILELIPELR